MQKTINDSFLGAIEYSEEYVWYEGKIKDHNGEVIESEFYIDNDNFDEILEFTRKVIKNLRDSASKFKLYAAEKLLDLYNDTWSEDEIIDRE